MSYTKIRNKGFSKRKRILTLWIFCLPILAYAQPEVIDLDKAVQEQEEEKQKREKVSNPYYRDNEMSDPRKTGLFKALFIAGVNGTQVDGDLQAGYYQWGFHGGIGTLVQFHRNISVSMELLYSMKGARSRPSVLLDTVTSFKINWDYLEVPLSLNFNDNKFFMVGVGMAPAVLVRSQEELNGRRENAQGDPVYLSPSGREPRRFDLSAFGSVSFIIKKMIAITGRFSYSVLPIRDAYPTSRVQNQYNNVITLRVMYILKTKKQK